MGSALVYNSGAKKGSQVSQKQGTGGLPVSQVNFGKRNSSKQQQRSNMPNVSVESRKHDYLSMCHDPQKAPSALPPVVLPARAIADKLYNETLLSTDANGNAGIFIRPRPTGMVLTVATWTGTTPATYSLADASQTASFNTNFQGYIPLCVEVVARYTGSIQSTSGRFYGQVGVPGNSTAVNVVNFPQEDFGCESLAADGASCTWYSTSPVWNNPQANNLSTDPTEWGDTTICVALVGGPASTTNLVSIGVYFHFAAFPKSGVVGLVPSDITADNNAALIAGLMSAATTGPYAAAMSAVDREKHRRKGLKIQDVIRVGGKVLGTISPYLGKGADAASLLAALMV